MRECIKNFYILNDEIEKCENFDDSMILKGKSLYEVIRIIDGVPLFFEEHMNRLKNSSNIMGVELWYSIDEIKTKIKKLIDKNSTSMGNVKLVFNYNDKNNFLLYFIKHHYPSNEEYAYGVNTILYHGERTNPNAKVINTDFRKAVDKEIKSKNVFEAILVDREGFITEGSKSNIFMIKGDTVITSPVEAVLPGVTRTKIIETCRNIGIQVTEKRVHFNEIKDMDGLFISGTSPKVLPIKMVDDLLFNLQQNNTLKKVMEGYNNLIDSYIEKF